MILHVPPGSSALVRGAADLVLALHVGRSERRLALRRDGADLRKGARLHRAAGNVFFVAMLIMAGVGACVAPFLPVPQWSSTGAGVFTCYLVATAWATVRRGEGRAGRFEVAAASRRSGPRRPSRGSPGWAPTT